jgi:hypothetical protein
MLYLLTGLNGLWQSSCETLCTLNVESIFLFVRSDLDREPRITVDFRPNRP